MAYCVQELRIRVDTKCALLLRSTTRRFLTHCGPNPLQLDSLVPIAESDITAIQEAAKESGFLAAGQAIPPGFSKALRATFSEREHAAQALLSAHAAARDKPSRISAHPRPDCDGDPGRPGKEARHEPGSTPGASDGEASSPEHDDPEYISPGERSRSPRGGEERASRAEGAVLTYNLIDFVRRSKSKLFDHYDKEQGDERLGICAMIMQHTRFIYHDGTPFILCAHRQTHKTGSDIRLSVQRKRRVEGGPNAAPFYNDYATLWPTFSKTGADATMHKRHRSLRLAVRYP